MTSLRLAVWTCAQVDLARRTRYLPTTVVSTTLDVPLRSHGSLSLYGALLAAGLVDRAQVTIFPVITGRTGAEPVLRAAADFDLELLESRTLAGSIQELVHRPTLHG